MRTVLSVVAAVLCHAAVHVSAQPPTGDDASYRVGATESATENHSELIVHPVRNTQPQQIADALTNLFRDDPRVKAVELSKDGTLFIRVSTRVREEVLRVLEVFDRSPHVVDVQVLLLKPGKEAKGLPQAAALCGTLEKVMETIEQLAANKQVLIADRIDIPTLERQKVIVARSHRVPFVDQIGGNPPLMQPGVALVDVGMLVDVTTRVVEASKVFVDLEFSATEIPDDVPIATPAGDITLPVIADTTVWTTLQLEDGCANAIGFTFNDAYNDSWPAILVIGCRIRGPGDGAEKASSPLHEGVGAKGLPRWLARKPPPADVSSRFLSYAVKFIEQYDSDNNKALSQEEWVTTRLSKTKPLADVDINGDGSATAEELAKALTANE